MCSSDLLALGNPVVPQYRQAVYCSRYQLQKLDFATRLQWGILRSTDGPLYKDLVTEDNLAEALDLIDRRSADNLDDIMDLHQWCRKSFPQYHILMYVMWHLSVKPDGPNTERAWKTAEGMLSGELEDETTIGLGSKWALLSALKGKAVAARQKMLMERGQVDLQVMEMPPAGLAMGAGGVVVDDIDLGGGGLGEENWPNWAALVQGFQLNDSHEFW